MNKDTVPRDPVKRSEGHEPKIFISYARNDELEMEQLRKHLRVLEWAKQVKVWCDSDIAPGAPWHQQINASLENASIAVLLVSASFLTSEFVLNDEVPTLLERHARDGLIVYPVLARPAAWREVPWLSKLLVRPRSGRAIWGSGDSSHADEALALIVYELAAIARKASSPAQRSAADRRAEEVGVAAVRACALEAQRSSKSLDVSALADLVRIAISHGSAVYNSGAIDSCTEIYRLTTATILEMTTPIVTNATSQRAPMGRPPMGEEEDEQFDAILSPEEVFRPSWIKSAALEVIRAKAIRLQDTRQKGDAAAWEYRHLFDQILHLDAARRRFVAVVEQDELADGSAATSAALRSILNSLVACHMAGMKAQQRPSGGAIWIESCAAILIMGGRALHGMLSRTSNCDHLIQERMHLDRALELAESELLSDPVRAAWEVHVALDRFEGLPGTVPGGTTV